MLRIATRKSRLALWQAEHVAERLRRAHPGLTVELVPMSTRGDRLLDRSLALVGGKGLFVKELEEAMVRGDADIAAHSMKDVPAQLPPGFVIGAILDRADPRDVLVSNHHPDLDSLPQGARLGTSSLRRQAQLAHRRPDLSISGVRGNVETRLRKLDEGEFDAIVLAAAGLERLGLVERIGHVLDPRTCLPAIGQGAIGIECRAEDEATRELVRSLEDPLTRRCVDAERALNEALGGSCVAPIAGHAVVLDDGLFLRGLVAQPDGTELVAGEVRGAGDEAAAMGRRLAEDLAARGARRILDALEHDS